MPKEGPIKPEYIFWRKRVEGQIRHMMNEHPEYFNLPDADAKGRCIRSMAKRIIGEIVAGSSTGNNSGRSATSSASGPDIDSCGISGAASMVVGGIPTADHHFTSPDN